ncbi:alpha/beta fold hydrolase [Streptomyces scopuliridis]|uniref:alpha/beta fold hydrolase n=1 Tax=Streptomyces scopuliridis TaxID=452529 RepID=UPI0034347F70
MRRGLCVGRARCRGNGRRDVLRDHARLPVRSRGPGRAVTHPDRPGAWSRLLLCHVVPEHPRTQRRPPGLRDRHTRRSGTQPPARTHPSTRTRRTVAGRDTLAGLGLERVHLVGSSYGGWLTLNQAHRRPDRIASVTLLDPGGLEKVGLRFFVWLFAGLFATFAPRALRPRLAGWLEQSVLIVPELRTMIRLGVRAYRIRRPSPLPLSEDELSTIHTPLYLVLGKRSLLVHPHRQVERVPRLIPSARAEIIANTGHGPQIDHADEINRRMLSFMDSID